MTEQVRPTDDIDILVELFSRWDYTELEEKLRQLGFQNDMSAKFVGRYIIDGIIVDLMPTDEAILGFSNIWYARGFKAAIEYKIDDFHTVKIFPSPYFIASKSEAFKNRGRNDGRMSSDFEDIIFVLENRNAVWDEMRQADVAVKIYLQNEFTALLQKQFFEEWIDAHAGFNSPPATNYILQQLQEFVKDIKS